MTQYPLKARIFTPPKSAMQSGRAKANRWHIDFITSHGAYQEPLMGWTGAKSTLPQINLTFPTSAAAAAYLDRYQIPYNIEEKAPEKIRGKSYSENLDPSQGVK